MRCPDCDCDNIPGVQLCEECGLDLAGLDIPEADEGLVGRLMTDRLSELTVISPLKVAAQATVEDVIGLLRQEHHGCVLIEDEGKLVGIFTERDVLVRVLRPGLDPADVPVSEVMSPDPLTLEPGDPPAFAIHRMVVGGLRHLPVVDGGKLLGFLSVRDVLRYLHDDVMAE